MTRRLTALYPFLLAAVGLLHLGAENPGGYDPGDLLLVLAVLLAGLAAVYLAAAALFRGRAAGRLPALVTFLAVLWLFGLPHLMRWFPGGPRNPRNLAVALLGTTATALAALWLARRPARLGTLATLLTLTGALLVVRFGADIAADEWRGRRMLEESGLVRELSRPIAAEEDRGPRRDIYLLVLDEYANAAVLRERFGYDNRAFEDSLRALGFHVPRVVRSNYFHTVLSLPSLLNAAHLHRLEDELPEGATDPTVVNALLDRSRVAAFLRGRGYRYVFFPSLWWMSTSDAPLADSVVQVWDGFAPGRELTRTEFRRVVQKETALRYALRPDPLDADHVRRTFESFGRLPEAAEPVFAFAHVLSPHSPYVLDRDCGTPPAPAAVERVEGYLGQLECVNAMVLRLVTRLLRDSEFPPVILIQGDHGTATLRYSDAPSAEAIPDSAARERFGAFGAYYLPDSGAAAFGDTVTVVNVLGNVLRHYFGAELPREPDDRYRSLEDTPYAFERATDPRLSHDPSSETFRRMAPAAPPGRVRAGTRARGRRCRGAGAGRARDAGGAGRRQHGGPRHGDAGLRARGALDRGADAGDGARAGGRGRVLLPAGALRAGAHAGGAGPRAPARGRQRGGG